MEDGSFSSCLAWSLDTLEEPPHWLVDAGQKTPTPTAKFNDRETRFSLIAHSRVGRALRDGGGGDRGGAPLPDRDGRASLSTGAWRESHRRVGRVDRRRRTRAVSV